MSVLACWAYAALMTFFLLLPLIGLFDIATAAFTDGSTAYRIILMCVGFLITMGGIILFYNPSRMSKIQDRLLKTLKLK